jgi:phytoene desaturase
MFNIIEGFEKVAKEQGVEIITSAEILSIEKSDSKATKIVTKNHTYDADIFISGADYHHTESLLNGAANYSQKYWDKRVMAPSCLLYYVGVSKKVDGLKHHNLFFDVPFENHALEIYKDPKWPENPLFYVCCPSKTDPSVAPEGKENLFFLIPIAPDLKDTEADRNRYFDLLLQRILEKTGEDLKPFIEFKRSFCIEDFKTDYHAFKGNAYGLANTLKQTAILKPSLKNKMLNNFYYTGQLTVPGPGVPPSIVSGEVVAKQVIKEHPLQKNTN